MCVLYSNFYGSCTQLWGPRICSVARDSSNCMLQIVETIVKIKLPQDVHGALHDGVILCHLANHLRPHSVSSVHVPSPSLVISSLVRSMSVLCNNLFIYANRNKTKYVAKVCWVRPRSHISNSHCDSQTIQLWFTLCVWLFCSDIFIHKSVFYIVYCVLRLWFVSRLIN